MFVILYVLLYSWTFKQLIYPHYLPQMPKCLQEQHGGVVGGTEARGTHCGGGRTGAARIDPFSTVLSLGLNQPTVRAW